MGCAAGTDGLHELRDAVGNFQRGVLWMGAGALWDERGSGIGGGYGCVCDASGWERAVAAAISIWAGGVAVENDDVWAPSTDGAGDGLTGWKQAANLDG